MLKDVQQSAKSKHVSFLTTEQSEDKEIGEISFAFKKHNWERPVIVVATVVLGESRGGWRVVFHSNILSTTVCRMF